jgi:transposase
MSYVKSNDCNQVMFCLMDELVNSENVARIIDAFIESLNLTNFKARTASREGKLSYD